MHPMAWEPHHSEFSAHLYLGHFLPILGSSGQITPLPACQSVWEEAKIALEQWRDALSSSTMNWRQARSVDNRKGKFSE